MRKTVAIALLASGCATAPSSNTATCNADKAQALIGRPWSDELQPQALKLSGARTLRPIPPGTAVTMDYRADRLNVEIDAGGKVTAVRCG